MTNLEQKSQLKEWKVIKDKIEEVGLIPDELTEVRKSARAEMWAMIKNYCVKYKTKFDYWNEPT